MISDYLLEVCKWNLDHFQVNYLWFLKPLNITSVHLIHKNLSLIVFHFSGNANIHQFISYGYLANLKIELKWISGAATKMGGEWEIAPLEGVPVRSPNLNKHLLAENWVLWLTILKWWSLPVIVSPLCVGLWASWVLNHYLILYIFDLIFDFISVCQLYFTWPSCCVYCLGNRSDWNMPYLMAWCLHDGKSEHVLARSGISS